MAYGEAEFGRMSGNRDLCRQYVWQTGQKALLHAAETRREGRVDEADGIERYARFMLDNLDEMATFLAEDGRVSNASEGMVRDERRLDKDGRQLQPKIWIVVRMDLAMPVEKAFAQVGHAVAMAVYRAMLRNPSAAAAYMEAAQAKISLGVDSEIELRQVVETCEAAGVPSVLVEDAGHTVFAGPTLTVAAIGPCLRSDLPKKVSRLRLLVTDVKVRRVPGPDEMPEEES